MAVITHGLGGLFSFQKGELTERLLAHTALVVAGEPHSWACKSTNVCLTQSGIFQMHICLWVQGEFEKQGGFPMR